jgi:hypothetical protein
MWVTETAWSNNRRGFLIRSGTPTSSRTRDEGKTSSLVEGTEQT